jgi:hypothetical protein
LAYLLNPITSDNPYPGQSTEGYWTVWVMRELTVQGKKLFGRPKIVNLND